MEIKETVVRKDIEYQVHPVGGRIYLLPPQIIETLYSGNNVDFYVSERRDLTPLVIGVMALNLVVAKTLGRSYPKSLIDTVLWRPEYIPICKKLVFKTENGIEASLASLKPYNFIYLRVSNIYAGPPVLRVLFSESIKEATISSIMTR